MTRLGLIGLGRLRLLSLRGGGFLDRLRLGLGLHGKHLLQRGDLVMLGHIVEHQIQLLRGQHLGVGLGLFIILGDDLRYFLGCHAEIRGNLFQTILH